MAIYVAVNALAHMAASPAVPAVAALRATAATSLAYGAGIKSCAAAGADPLTAIALASCAAPAAVAAAAARGGAARNRATIFAATVAKTVPAGLFFAAEYAAFLVAKDAAGRVAATTTTTTDPRARTPAPAKRCAVGVAAIAAVCAAGAPFAAATLLAARVTVGRGASFSIGAAGSRLVAETRGKFAWYGAFEGLKCAAHGEKWDASLAPTTARVSQGIAAVSRAVSAATVARERRRVVSSAVTRRSLRGERATRGDARRVVGVAKARAAGRGDRRAAPVVAAARGIAL
jgi:hypothetical protein